MSFRTCSCGCQWSTREDFLNDPKISLVGYQVNYEHLREGFFLFNHLSNGCLTTLSIPAADFLGLYAGEIFTNRLDGTHECSGHCLHQSDLAPCPSRCECAFVREVVDMVTHWPKQSAT